MPENNSDQKDCLESVERREFCRKTIKQTLIATGLVAAPYAAYKRPEVRSFFGARDAYAATTTGPTLAAPTGLTATVISSTQIDLSWTDNSTGETGSIIERSDDSGVTWTEIARVGANVTSYNDTTVAEGTSYTYRVRAYNSGGSSGYANEPTGVDPTIASQFGNATFGQATFQ